MADILEASTLPNMDTVVTVRTRRGEEVRMNSDEAVKALADFFSDLDNERRFGWQLTTAWYDDELTRLRQRIKV